MKAIVMMVALVSSSMFFSDDILTGRWQTKPSPKGNVTGMVFKSNNSFEGYVNKKPFVSGTYTLEENIFSFVDNGCNGEKGVYRLIFFSNSDSMRFEPVSDNCLERKEGMSRMVVGRVK
jgi:hypothetical protein